MLMKTRYIIIIDQDEEPILIRKESNPDTTSFLIIARTPEEARRLLDQHKTQ